MAKRQYSDTDRAAALAALDANDGNVKLTSRQTSVPIGTLRAWRDAPGTVEGANIRTLKKGDLADRLEEVAHLMLDALPGKLLTANAKDVATALGIAVDKMQNLRGKPNVIIDDAGLSDEARAEGVAALLDRARARRVGPAAEPAIH